MNDTITEELQAKALNALDANPGILQASTNAPYSILVYTEETNQLEAVELQELPLLYPCSGRSARWNFESFGRVVVDKALLHRKRAGTLCIAISSKPFPYRVFTVYEGEEC